jgi:hypothetical protein
MAYRPLVIAALLALAAVMPAGAQSPSPVFHQSVGSGIRWLYPISLEGSSDVNGSPGATASWRYWTGPHFGVEGAFGWWSKDHHGEYHSGGYMTPGGYVQDQVDMTYQSSLSYYGLGGNILGRIPIGRAAVVAGGGPGFFVERGHYEQRFNGQRDSNTHTGHHFGVEGLMELEVRATDRFSVFGGLHVELRSIDNADSGFTYPVLGARMAF